MARMQTHHQSVHYKCHGEECCILHVVHRSVIILVVVVRCIRHIHLLREGTHNTNGIGNQVLHPVRSASAVLINMSEV